jgi:hypothetical protein
VATLAGGGEGGLFAQMGRFRLSAAFLWWTLLDGVFCYSVPSGRTALGGFLGIHFEVAEASRTGHPMLWSKRQQVGVYASERSGAQSLSSAGFGSDEYCKAGVKDCVLSIPHKLT